MREGRKILEDSWTILQIFSEGIHERSGIGTWARAQYMSVFGHPDEIAALLGDLASMRASKGRHRQETPQAHLRTGSLSGGTPSCPKKCRDIRTQCGLGWRRCGFFVHNAPSSPRNAAWARYFAALKTENPQKAAQLRRVIDTMRHCLRRNRISSIKCVIVDVRCRVMPGEAARSPSGAAMDEENAAFEGGYVAPTLEKPH